MRESTLEGRKSYVLEPEKASLIVMDEKTLMLGTDSFLKKMLNARGASSPLLSRLKQTDVGRSFEFDRDGRADSCHDQRPTTGPRSSAAAVS